MKKQFTINIPSTVKTIFVVVLFSIFIFSADQASAAIIKIEPLHKVLRDVQNIKDLWGHTRNLVNVVVIAALVYVAFMNILRLQINNFAIKKILPTLILAIILANFSYFICRILIDFANIVIDLLMNGVQGTTGAGATVNSSSVGVAGAFDFTDQSKFPIDPNNLNRSFIFILAEFAGGVMILILAFLFFIRNYVIYFLIVLGPLAFMSLVLPQTKKLFDQWWNQMLKWIYLPVISIFWLWLGGMWYSSGFTSSGGSVESARTGDLNSAVLALAFAGVCYYLAITTPFKVGGAIMGKYGDLGKKAWGQTGGRAVENGKWLATGGFQKMMTHKNQMAAARAQADDDEAAKKKYLKRAERWTKANPWARYDAFVANRAATRASYDKAAVKTQSYAGWLGDPAAIDAGFEANIDDYRAMSNTATGKAARGKVKKHWADLKKNRSKYYQRFMDAAIDPENAEEYAQLGYSDPEAYAQHLWLQEVATRGKDKLAVDMKGSGISGFDLGDIKAVATEYMKVMRSNKRDEARNVFEDISGSDGGVFHAVSGVGTDGPIDPDELAQAATPPPPPPADGGGGQQAPQPPQPSPQTREAAKQVNEEMSAEQHKKIAEGLNGGGVGVLNVTAQDIQAHTQSAGLNIPPSALENFAKAATQSNMQIADEIRGRVNEKNNLAHSEALVSSGIMSQLAETPRAKDRVNDLLQIARDGQAGLGQNNAEGLGNAVAAAQLVNPDSAVLLEGLQRRGETDKLEEHVTRILSTAEKQLDDLSKKNGVVLAEQISDFKQKGAGEWQKQVVAESMKEAPQEAHREVIIQQSAERLASLPDNATNQQLMETLNKGFDAMIASNQELHGALGQLGGEDQIKALKEAQSGLADVLDKSIRAAFPTMNENDRLSGSIQKEAMVKAMTDPQVTQGLAQAFGKSMNKSLETTNQMLSKGAKGAKNMDIRPPATD
ncbi:MAG: TrbL/VirB6 plasmid conjugal transfer protein [bacterium ADurb.Bin212]|nr:MAG: TrbL/VirB6 plasmid conjugal transfer protein [bacterium ADurb.Bin212]